MDFLGLFDGLFTALSAMRSGKSVDDDVKDKKPSINATDKEQAKARNKAIMNEGIEHKSNKQKNRSMDMR